VTGVVIFPIIKHNQKNFTTISREIFKEEEKEKAPILST